MNSLIETLNRLSNDALPIAWKLFWQSGLLIVVIGSLDFLLRKQLRASVRYALWLVVLIKLLLPPTLALPTGIAWWLRPSDPLPNVAPPKQLIVTYPANPLPKLPELIQQTPVTPPPPRLTIQAWSMIAAGSISAALLAWLVIRWIQISQLVRSASEPSESICAMLRQARKRVQHPGSAAFLAASCSRNDPKTRRLEDGAPRIRLTKEKMSPAVCGLFRPVILLPESLAENLSPSQLRAVLIHELVHLKRRDVWVNCLQALLQIIYWWNPLVWFANARIRRVREEAVDDAVMLAMHEEADCYAPTLLEVAKLAFHRPLASLGLVGILESRSALRQRVERLIDFKAPRRAGLSFGSVVAIAAFTATAVPMGEAPTKKDVNANSTISSVNAPTETRIRWITANRDNFKTNEIAQIRTSNLVQDARLLFELGKLDDAETKLQQALAIESRNPAAIYYLELIRHSREKAREKTPPSENYQMRDLVYRHHSIASRDSTIQVAKNSAELQRQTVSASPLNGVLAFDKELQETNVNTGEVEAHFKFSLTNVSAFAVTITNVQTSCGCTVAKMPASPWLLAPGATGEIPVTMNVAGKSGVVTKTVSVMSDRGTKTLLVKATILPAAISDKPLVRTNPRRQTLMQKLDQIRFDTVAFDSMPLSEVIRQLTEQVKRRDPDLVGINFLINPQGGPAPVATIDPSTGLPVPSPANTAPKDINTIPITINPPLKNVRLSDVLDAIVTMASPPIKYSVLDYAVVFSFKSGNESLPLRTRRFKVDPNTFKQGLEGASGVDFSKPTQGVIIPRVAINGGEITSETQSEIGKSVQLGIVSFFKNLGVNLDPPKSVFFSDRRGDLMVRATEEDLDLIEQAVQSLNTAPPQVNIRVKFVLMPKELADTICPSGTTVTNGVGVVGILTASATKQLLERLKLTLGVFEITDGNMTTLGGRQTQFQATVPTTVVVGVSNGVPETKPISIGPVLDVVPDVGADGRTIQMTAIPTFTEFLGYQTSELANTNGQLMPLPHLRVRQTKTSAVVWDGQTLVLGRLPQTDLIVSNTKTSTSATTEDQLRSLVVLVTATLIDPAGNRIHTEE